jgi:hypothetical protein
MKAKRLLIILALIMPFIGGISNLYASNDRGTVVYDAKGDYYVIETDSYDYVIVELYSGSLYEGDILFGDFTSYGFQDCYNQYDSEIRIYIEDWGLTKSSAIRWLENHDKIRD